MVDKQPILPVYILSGEFRRIGLSCTRFIKEFVVGALFWILLARDNLRVLFRRHSAAVLAANLRPDPLGEDRPGQPAQIASQVVQAAEIVGDRVSVAVND